VKKTSVVLMLLALCACFPTVATAACTEPATAAGPDTLVFLSSLAAPEASLDLVGVGVPAPIALACGPDFCTQAQKDECDELCYPCNGRHTCNFQTCVFSCTCGFNCDF
jgi:hypothetical protein